MTPGTPWRTIQRLHRLFWFVEFVFIVSFVTIFAVVPEALNDRYLFIVWASLVPFALILWLWPSPCPKCGKPFLLFSIGNGGKAVGLLIKNMFHPFRYFSAFLFPRCPHCETLYKEDL
jgi:hypothetical protein